MRYFTLFGTTQRLFSCGTIFLAKIKCFGYDNMFCITLINYWLRYHIVVRCTHSGLRERVLGYGTMF